MIVLDTNVVSEAMRPQPDPGVLAWLNAQSADTMYLSSVTLAELLFGIGALPAGARKDRLTQALDRLLALFPKRVLPFNQESARRYAEMAVTARAAGRPLPTADGYLAPKLRRDRRECGRLPRRDRGDPRLRRRHPQHPALRRHRREADQSLARPLTRPRRRPRAADPHPGPVEVCASAPAW